MSTVREDPHVKLIVLDHPLQEGPRTRTEERVTLTEGVTVRDVLPERVVAEPGWIVVEQGRVIPPDEWAAHVLQPASELVCYRRVHGAVGRIVAGVFLMVVGGLLMSVRNPFGLLVFGAGLSLLSGGVGELLAPAPPVPLLSQSSSESSPTYGFSGIKNSLRIGAPIPVVYGEHRVAGQVVQVLVRAETTVGNLTGTGTMEIVYAEQFQTSQHDEGQAVSALTDQWMQVTGTGTAFLSALPPGSRFRCAGQEFTVRETVSNTALTAHYGGQSNVAAGAAWAHIRNAPSTGDNEMLHLLLAVSEGEIASISDIQIQGQAISHYRDVTTEVTLGTNNQGAITLFGNHSTTQVAADALITETVASYTTVASNLTALELHIQFPQGLFAVSDAGGLAMATVDLEVEYKVTSALSWTAFGPLSVSDAKRSVLRRNLRIEGLTPGQYEVRIKRTSPESTSLRRVDSVRRTAVSEIVHDAYRYPNTALLAVKALATDQISGGLPTITSQVAGVKVMVFTTASAFTVQWTDNPAWVVFDLLTQRRYGMGQFVWPITRSGSWTFTNGSATVTGSGFTGRLVKGHKLVVWLTATTGAVYTVLTVLSDTQCILTGTFSGATGAYRAEAHRNDLDLQAFVNWAAFCDVLVSDGQGGTEKRATCNMVFDQQSSNVWDAANKVCGLGLASLVKLGNYITVKYQQAEASVQLFTMGNIVAGSFKESFLPLDQRANVFEVAYLNAANQYEQEMITLEDPLLYTNSEQERKQTIQVYGATRASHAARLARFYQNANRYLTRTIEFAAGIDAIAAEPGDVIDFQHDVPQWGFGGRVGIGSTASTVVVDQPMTVQAGKTYQVKVRFSDDTRQTNTVTNAPGTHTTLTISGPWSGGTIPADGDVFAFGETNIVTKPYRLIAVERTPEFTAKLMALEYDAAVYDETNLTPVNVVPFSALPNLAGPPPQVSDLLMTQLSNESILVTFSPPTDPRYQTTYLYRMFDGRPELVGESRHGQAVLNGFAPGELLVIRAVAVSSAGVQANIQQAPLVVLNVQQRTLPPNVTGLELLGQGHDTAFVGREARFQWRRSSIDGGVGLDSLGRERLGLGADGTAVALFKNYRVEFYNQDGLTLRRREFLADPCASYAFEKNYEDAQRINGSVVRTFTIKVWAQDIYNQLSARPAVLTVSNAAPAAVHNLTGTATATGAMVYWDKSTEPDVTGYVVHRGTSAGFTPSAGNQVANGPSTVFVDDNLTVGTTYYYKVAAYDTFDESSLNYSGAMSATPIGIGNTQIADGAISTPKLAAGSVVAGKIAANAITAAGAEIADATIATAKIIDAAITTAKIADVNITTAKINDAAITTAKIADANITTAKINDAAITTAKIADANITTAKINDAAIQTAQIADLTVSTLKIANNAVTNRAEVRAGSVLLPGDYVYRTVASITITTSGGSVLVMARCKTEGQVDPQLSGVRITRGATVLESLDAEATGGGGGGTLFALFDLDAPPAGTHVYAVSVMGTNNGQNIFAHNIGLWVTEYLK